MIMHEKTVLNGKIYLLYILIKRHVTEKRQKMIRKIIIKTSKHEYIFLVETNSISCSRVGKYHN